MDKATEIVNAIMDRIFGPSGNAIGVYKAEGQPLRTLARHLVERNITDIVKTKLACTTTAIEAEELARQEALKGGRIQQAEIEAWLRKKHEKLADNIKNKSPLASADPYDADELRRKSKNLKVFTVGDRHGNILRFQAEDFHVKDGKNVIFTIGKEEVGIVMDPLFHLEMPVEVLK